MYLWVHMTSSIDVDFQNDLINKDYDGYSVQIQRLMSAMNKIISI